MRCPTTPRRWSASPASSAMTAAPPSPATCSAISTVVQGHYSKLFEGDPTGTVKLPDGRLCGRSGRSAAARASGRARLQEAGRWWRAPLQQWMAGDYRVLADRERPGSAFVEFVPGADRRPGACRGARQRGDRVRPLPAGAAARRPADLAAQPEPRPGGAGGADPRRGAAARRHAGAAAADHGRADRSALLRRDAGPQRIVGAAGGDADGRRLLRGVSRPAAAVRPGEPVPDRHPNPVRHGVRPAGQRRLCRRRRGHRRTPCTAW